LTDQESLETGLILRALARTDDRAFGQLVAMHQNRVRGLLRRLCGDHSTADDLAQEVFVIAHQRLATYQGRGRFGAWLCSIAYRQFLQAQRKWQREQEINTQLATWQDLNLPPDLQHQPDQIDLERALQCLPFAESAAITLNMTMGFSQKEVANVMQLPLGTVKSHIHRGLNRLRQQLSVAEPAADSAVKEKSA